MRHLIAAAAGFVCALTGVSASNSATTQSTATAGDCVTIGKPKPTAAYVSQHSESSGKTSTVTQVWESVTDTGSRLKWTGPAGSWLQVNEHRIVDDVSVLDRTSKQDLNGTTIEATTFRPGIIGDPAFRACAGRTWQIPAVTAYFQAGTLKVTSQTPAGTLKIIGLHERVTVPAGTFDTVRYIRTSQSMDEYWKSIEQGVVVKHVAKVNGQTITETLISIK